MFGTWNVHFVVLVAKANMVSVTCFLHCIIAAILFDCSYIYLGVSHVIVCVKHIFYGKCVAIES